MLLFLSGMAFAQVDSSTSDTLYIENEKAEEKPLFDTEIDLPRATEEDPYNGMNVPESRGLNTDEGFSMIDNEKFGNPGELYEKQIQRHKKGLDTKEDKTYGSTTNQYFGDFKTTSQFVSVAYRDHEYPDGDRIRVMVNDEVALYDVTLTTGFDGFKLDLKPGFNKIDFVALNQGESGPNTAQFEVLDEDGNTISGNMWNLATGVKATIIIVKEEKEEED